MIAEHGTHADEMSIRNGVTPKLKLTLTLTLTDTEGAVLTLMLGYRSLYITWQQQGVCKLRSAKMRGGKLRGRVRGRL